MGISIWQLLIVLLIVVVLFGTKRLRDIGGDLGAGIRGFRNAMNEGKKDSSQTDQLESNQGETIDARAEEKDQAH